MDETREYKDRVLGYNTAGFMAIGMAMGSELVLFDLMIGENRPMSSQEIADKANMKERYVREWLGAMTSGKIVQIKDDKYHIPEYGQKAVQSESAWSLALFVLSSRRKDIKNCFAKDGPKGKERLTEYHSRLFCGLNLRSINSVTLKCVDRKILRIREFGGQNLTFNVFRPSYIKSTHTQLKPGNMVDGINYNHDDIYWTWFAVFRDKATDELVKEWILPGFKENGILEMLDTGIDILDIGCQSGHFSVDLARRYPKSRFVCLDPTKNALQYGITNAQMAGLVNIIFMQGDAHALPDTMQNQFGLVMLYEIMHALADPPTALAQVAKVLKHDGIFSLIDLGQASNHSGNAGNMFAGMFYIGSLFTFLPNSLSAEGSSVDNRASLGCEEIKNAVEEKFDIVSQYALYRDHFHLICKQK